MWVPPAVIDLATACAAAGGRAWLVGGVVRDHLLGRETVDFDIEVHGVQAGELATLLRRFGRVSEVGRSFGVYRIQRPELAMDVSLPRRDSNSGPGHRGIQVHGDPFLGIVEAARRRDLTINAIMIDPLSGEEADPFGGRADIRDGLLRAVDAETFLDDPLRALRVVQFAGRFGFQPTPELVVLCRRAPLNELPGERLAAELEKLLLASPRPSVGLQVALDCEVIARVLPELAAVGVQGLGEVLDRAALQRSTLDPGLPPLALMWGCLVHRLDPAQAEALLDRLRIHSTRGYPLRARVLGAVASWPTVMGPLDDTALRTLAEQQHLALVLRIALAVGAGDQPRRSLERAVALGIADQALPALIGGRQLAPLGVKPGPGMGELLAQIRRAQLQGEVASASDALELARRLVGSSILTEPETA